MCLADVGWLSWDSRIWLRRFVAQLEPEAYRRATLRGLLAPELAPVRFDETLDDAESNERSCAG